MAAADRVCNFPGCNCLGYKFSLTDSVTNHIRNPPATKGSRVPLRVCNCGHHTGLHTRTTSGAEAARETKELIDKLHRDGNLSNPGAPLPNASTNPSPSTSVAAQPTPPAASKATVPFGQGSLFLSSPSSSAAFDPTHHANVSAELPAEPPPAASPHLALEPIMPSDAMMACYPAIMDYKRNEGKCPHMFMATPHQETVQLSHASVHKEWHNEQHKESSTSNIGLALPDGVCVGIGWAHSRADLNEDGKTLAGATYANGTFTYYTHTCMCCGETNNNHGSAVVAQLTEAFTKALSGEAPTNLPEGCVVIVKPPEEIRRANQQAIEEEVTARWQGSTTTVQATSSSTASTTIGSDRIDSKPSPHDTIHASTGMLEPNEGIVAQLMSMGFGEHACKRAASITSNNLQAAIEWVLSQTEDSGFNSFQPLPPSGDTPTPNSAVGTAVSTHAADTKFCDQCGKGGLRASANFCKHCGKEVG